MEAPIALNTNWGMLGHEWAVNLLRRQIADGRLGHAYLFTGPLGVGRRSLALRLAQAVNCTQPPAPGEPCGECRACRGFGRGQHPDLLLVERQEGDREIKIDALRALTRSLSRTPLEARYQVALILNFHHASEEAANALLKTLEEPNPSVLLCLTALDADSIPATVVSRCEVLRLRPLAPETLTPALQSSLGIDAAQAHLLASVSQGLPGLAIRMQQEPALLESRGQWLDVLHDLLFANRVKRFAFADKASKDRQQLKNILLVWLSFWRDVLVGASGAGVTLANVDKAAEIGSLGQKIGFPEAAAALQAVERAVTQLETNVNARLVLEVLLLELPWLPS